MIDALLHAAKDPAKLMFRTLWNNVTIGTVIMNGFPRAALTGTDALTGFDCVTDIQSFFGASAVLEMQYYLEDRTKYPVGTQPLPAPDVADQLEATIVSSTLTSIANANDLQLDYKYRATTPGNLSFPQIWLTIYRQGAATRADVDEMYMSFIYELPADLATRLVSGSQNYLAIWDWKTDGYLSQAYGDLRLKAEIVKSSVDGRLYWNFAIDNVANGWSIVPSVATSIVTYQSVQFDDTNIPLGEPFKFEVYFRRPTKINSRSTVKEPGATEFRYDQDLKNGIFRAGITILSTGEFLPLCDFVGGRMMGAENLPFGRCFQGMYTPGIPPMTCKIGDWQIWDSIPAHSKLRLL